MSDGNKMNFIPSKDNCFPMEGSNSFIGHGTVGDILVSKRTNLEYIMSFTVAYEQRQSEIIDCVPDGVLFFREGKFVNANKAFYKLFGYNESEMIEMNSLLQLLDPTFYAEIQARIRDGEYGIYELIAIKKDGTKIPVEIHIQENLYRGRIISVVSFRDLTDIENEKEKLRVTNEKLSVTNEELHILQEKFEALFENTPMGTFYVQEDGKLDLINSAGEKITGYSREELTQMHYLDIIHPDDRGFVKEHGIMRLRGENTEIDYETRIVTKSGDIKIIKLFPSRVTISGKKYLMGGILDVTDQRTKEQILAMSASLLGHEIKNKIQILQLLRGMFETLLLSAHKRENNNKTKETNIILLTQKLEEMDREITNLSEIVETTLYLEKIELGKGNLQDNMFDIREFLAAVIVSHQFIANKNGVNIIIEVDIDNPMILLDNKLLKVVLNNLLGNAVKFTRNNTQIIVNVTQKDTDNGPMVIISVKDEGKGMSEDCLARIGKPYYQAHQDTQGGTGLGIWISHWIANKLKAQLEVESIINYGTTFSLIFPDRIRSSMKKTMNDNSKFQLESCNSIRSYGVLVIEDGRDSLKLTKKLFERDGYVVDTVSNGLEALEKMRNIKYDLIFVDLCLPGNTISGLDVIECIRAENSGEWKTGAGVDIIANSASINLKEQSLSSGANYFLPKPIIQEDFSGIVGGVKEKLQSLD